MLSSGFPGIQGLSDDDALRFVRYFIERHPDLVIDKFRFTTSYTEEILEQARNFAENERYEFASMFYVTWIEHTLNSLIADELRFQRKRYDEIQSTIRNSTLKKKMTTVWISVFGASLELPTELVQRVLSLADVRNEFAHYKWRASRAQDPLELRDLACAAMGPAESVVDDLCKIAEMYMRRHSQISES